MPEAKEPASLPDAVKLLRPTIVLALAISLASTDKTASAEPASILDKLSVRSSLTRLLSPAERTDNQQKYSSSIGKVLPIISLGNVRLGIGPVWNNTKGPIRASSDLAGASVEIKWEF